jgi:hypothetical protein
MVPDIRRSRGIPRRTLATGLAVGLLAVAAPVASGAEPLDDGEVATPPVPEVEGPVEVTDDSYPFLAAGHADFPTIPDLPRGFVEEEHFVTGSARIYKYDENQEAVVRDADPLDYSTRLLVRRPADPRDFNGTVVVEIMNPSVGFDIDTKWLSSARYFGDSGTAYVGITVPNSGATQPISHLQGWNPGRYSSLGIPERGATYDIVSQVGALLRDEGDGNPLSDLGVERLFLTGASQSGTIIRTYLGEGFHERWDAADGGPLYDGYVITISSGPFVGGYWAINADTLSTVVDPLDPRRTIGAHGVPVIEVLSEGESATHLTALRDDSDAPDDRYRLYQVAGARHNTRAVEPVCGAPGETVTADYPSQYVMTSTFANLDRWVVSGEPMPRAPRLELADGPDDFNRPLVRDEDGNAVGGLRMPAISVPTATYSSAAEKTVFGAERLEELYPTHGSYVRQVNAAVREAEHEGWLVPADAREIRAQATRNGTHC